jgi:ferric-dicitrate binding protein FerR (iron transport regulator)
MLKMEELLNRYFAGTLPEEDKAVLFNHLERNDALRAEYVRLQNTVAVSAMISREGDEEWTVKSFRKTMHRAGICRRRRILLAVMKYAASVFILAGTWFLSKEYASGDRTSGYTLIEAPKGQRVHITLNDGTQVWLSSRTQLKVPSRFNGKSRVVELNGEGLFSVSENKQKPFTVQTKQYDIQAVGTQFNVFAYSESTLFETDLIEGSVFVVNRKRKNHWLSLLPNEKAFGQSGQLRKSPSLFIQAQHIRNGIYSFESQSLKDLARRLELWYDVKIHITKPEMAAGSFSGKFRQTDDIGHILQAIGETGKFKYRLVDEKHIELY